MAGDFDPFDLFWPELNYFNAVVVPAIDLLLAPPKLGVPECLGKPTGLRKIGDRTVADTESGIVMIVPRADTHRMLQLVQAYTRTYVRAMRRLTFEVNTLARIEKMLAKVGLRWYQADHNATQFTHYD